MVLDRKERRERYQRKHFKFRNPRIRLRDRLQIDAIHETIYGDMKKGLAMMKRVFPKIPPLPSYFGKGRMCIVCGYKASRGVVLEVHGKRDFACERDFTNPSLWFNTKMREIDRYRRLDLF